MSDVDYVNNPLWKILVETVHSIHMFEKHKNYVRNVILREKPKIDADELAFRLGITMGEALVILHELKPSSKADEPVTPSG